MQQSATTNASDHQGTFPPGIGQLIPVRPTPPIKWTPTCVRSLRTRLGMSQVEMAKTLGIKRSRTVSDWERGVSHPGNRARAALARLIAQTAANIRREWSGEQVAALRVRLNLTRRQFAALAEVGYTSVWEWETGRSRPGRKACVRLTVICDLTPLEATRMLMYVLPNVYGLNGYGLGSY